MSSCCWFFFYSSEAIFKRDDARWWSCKKSARGSKNRFFKNCFIKNVFYSVNEEPPSSHIFWNCNLLKQFLFRSLKPHKQSIIHRSSSMSVCVCVRSNGVRTMACFWWLVPINGALSILESERSEFLCDQIHSKQGKVKWAEKKTFFFVIQLDAKIMCLLTQGGDNECEY